MTGFIQVFTTVDKREDAEQIARTLVEQKLAACVQIVGPVTSCFTWQEKLDTAEELLCIIKSRKGLLPELEKTIKNLHPYDVPEIIAMPITGGGRDYLEWMARELRPEPPPE